MTSFWTLGVARDDLARSVLVANDAARPGDGEVLLRVDRIGLTANNVTYAVLGDAFRYWEFFPPEARKMSREWGLTPVWGFCEVASSRVPGVTEGQRYYGYLPPASHLVARPGRVDERGFADAAPHRRPLPSPYNAYSLTSSDAVYEQADEDLLVLFRPLFYTSWMLADQLADRNFHGATTLVFSSASSKTAFAAAYELRDAEPEVVGLTSPHNVEFVRALGCYDRVLGYDEVAALDRTQPTVYVDLSGAPAHRKAVREHLGDHLVQDIAVGLTTQMQNADRADRFFFAPDHMRKRTEDWGRAALDARFADAWRGFRDFARTQITVAEGHGPQALQAAWLDTVTGRTPPSTGHVIQL
jgi:uncharacterized protein DUF2855